MVKILLVLLVKHQLLVNNLISKLVKVAQLNNYHKLLLKLIMKLKRLEILCKQNKFQTKVMLNARHISNGLRLVVH